MHNEEQGGGSRLETSQGHVGILSSLSKAKATSLRGKVRMLHLQEDKSTLSASKASPSKVPGLGTGRTAVRQ